MTTGLALGGAAYGIGLIAAVGDGFENEKGWLLLPLVGPWITLSARDDRLETTSSRRDTGSGEASFARELVLAMDGAMQGAGALLILIGYAAPRAWLVRDSTANLAVHPAQLGRDGYGVALGGAL